MVDYYERTEETASIGTIAAKAVCKNIIRQPRKIENSIINTICLINKHISYFKNCILILELDNAMTKKANSTSRQMVDDIAQIKRFINRE